MTIHTTDMTSDGQHRATVRVLSIFEYLTDTENVGKSLTEIANYLKAPKSSILPILRTLVDFQYLHYNTVTMQYFLGYKLYEIGTKYVGETNVDDAIQQVMQEFASNHGVTLLLGELVAGDVLVIQKVDLFEKLRLYRAVGRRIPAYSDASGKVLLAEKSDAEIMKLYSDGLIAYTEKTITDPAVLFEQLDIVRQTGVATCDEETTRYVRSVAVPIKKNGSAVYAIEASLSIFEYTEEKERELILGLYELKAKIENLIKRSDAVN